MDREEESFGNAATAARRVAYSPDVVVPALTTRAPEGGEVRETATTDKARARSWSVSKNIETRV